jgi:hypothetical protein
MKIMFWETDYPKDRITLSIIFFISFMFLARIVIASSSNVKNISLGAINPVDLKGKTYYLSDSSLYFTYFIFTLMCILVGVILINMVIILLQWFRQHNAR